MEHFIPAAIALGFFLFLGVSTWSYRDVANRQTKSRAGADHDAHGAGH